MLYNKLLIVPFLLFSIKIGPVQNVKELPSYYPRCYRDDPKLNECLLKATEQVRPYLQKGVPELGLPLISPFSIPEITLEQGTGSVKYKASLKNVVITGLDSYSFTKFDFDVQNLKFFGAVDMRHLYVEGDYFVNGKILAVPLEGKGRLSANITNSNGTLSQQAKLVKKHNITFLTADRNATVIKINVGDVKYQIEGLFDENEVLARAAREVIRDNLRELIEEVKPAVEEVLTRITEDILFRSIAQVPYDKLYPVHNKNT